MTIVRLRDNILFRFWKNITLISAKEKMRGIIEFIIVTLTLVLMPIVLDLT